MKKTAGISLALALCVGLSPMATAASTTQAAPNSSKIYVDGQQVQMSAYTINNNNYFKLRDLAYVLSGSSKQFNVTWDDEQGAVEIIPGVPYISNGQEMRPSTGTGSASPSFNTFLYKGDEISLTAYDIGGNNFVKLRDVGALMDCSVEWDAATSSIVVDTTKGYTPDANTVLSPEAKTALAQLTYYGDRSKCTMSQAQMKAYAQTLMDEYINGYETPLETDVFLADLEDNGNPYLVVSRPAPGVGNYAPVVYSYVNDKVQLLCDCWDGSASGGYVSWVKNGRVMYVEWETNDMSGYRNDMEYEYYTFFNGGLVECGALEEDSGSDPAKPSLYTLCYPGYQGSDLCVDAVQANQILLQAASGGEQGEKSKMAAAMLAVVNPSSGSESILQARLIDLNGDGMEELFLLTYGGGTLYFWQDGTLVRKDVGAYAGGSLNWYLCRDTVTGELGIEYSSEGGGDFSGGTNMFFYLSHTTEIDYINGQYYVNGSQATQAQYEAAKQSNIRGEALGGDNQTANDYRDETMDALLDMMVQ